MALGLWILWGVLGVAIAIMLAVGLYRSGRPVRSLIASGLQGICALAAVNITGAFTGVSLGLNVLTGAFGLLLGVPGIITLLILKVIFGA